MRFSYFLPLALLAPRLAALDTAVFETANPEKNAKFTSREVDSDGVLHLVDRETGNFNNSLYYTLRGKELDPYRGKFVEFSCEMRQVAASADNCVGVSVSLRTPGNRWFGHGSFTGTRGKTDWKPYRSSIYVPADAVQVNLSIDCARNYGRTGEAYFRNLKLESAVEGTAKTVGALRNPLIKAGDAALSWNYRESAGIHLGGDREFILTPLEAKGGTVSFSPAERKSLLFNSVNENSFLELDVEGGGALDLELVTYGKRNRSIRVEKAQGTIRVPLTDFAPVNDLVEFNALEITTASPLTVKKIGFTGLAVPAPGINLLPDPSFEESTEALPPYGLLGEYRAELLQNGASIDSGRAFHGSRSLKLEPGGRYRYTVFDQAGNGAVFSCYSRADGPGKLEVALQPFVIDMHGESTSILRREFPVGNEWERKFVSFPAPEKKVVPQQSAFYRIELANSGKAPVWIDAVQLEQDREKPGEFSPVRDSRVHHYFPPGLTREDFPARPAGVNRKNGSVPLSVLNSSGKRMERAVISGGVPFAPGEVHTVEGLNIKDAAGGVVEAQFTPLAFRPLDGSILSVKVDFQADLLPGNGNCFTLEYGGATSKASPEKLAAATGGGVKIDTGRLAFELVPGNQSLLRDSLMRCVVETLDGKRHLSGPDLIEIEENGPLTATVLLRGWAELAWELRITVFRNKPFCRIDYAFENTNIARQDPLNRTVKAVYLELPGGRTYHADKFSGEGKALLIQRQGREGEEYWDVFEQKAGREIRHPGLRLTGNAGSGKALFRIENLWEKAPRGFGFGPDATRLYLWPGAGVAPLDAPLGLSGSMRVWYAPEGGELPGAPPLLLPGSDYLEKCGVFGPLLPKEVLAKEFPRSWKLADDVFEALYREAEIKDMYGFLDFGDFGSRRRNTNHETSAVRNLWTRYLRTGERRDYDMALAHSLHQRDVDLSHADRFRKGVYPHYSWTHINYNFHTGHFWLTGLVYHYLLTGDRRTFDAICGSSVILIQKAVLKYPSGRERHRLLFHLAEIYELTGHPALRQAFELHYNHGGVSDETDYYGALAHEALLKLYQVTGEQKYLDRLNAEAAAFRNKNASVAPMPEDRTRVPTLAGSADEGRGAMRHFMETEMALRTGDAGFLGYLSKGAEESYLWSMLSPNGRDTSLEWALSHPGALRRFGRREDGRLPEHYSFIHRFAGRMPIENGDTPFMLRLKPDREGKVILDLYRIRGFRYWSFKRTGDKVTAKAIASNGNVIAQTELYGNLPAEYARMEFAAPGENEVQIELRFWNDCWGGVSTPNLMTVDAARHFSARTAIAVPVGFYLRAPENGQLEVNWRWKDNQSAEALGIRLEGPDGTPVAGHFYSIPLDSAQQQYSARLSIPAEFRGKILRCWMSDAKWIEWKINGADRFADRPESLE